MREKEKSRPAASGAPTQPLGPSQRSNVASFIVMDVMQAAAQLETEGRSIIHMEVGQPATAAPKAARDAIHAALETETLGYTLALGRDALRDRIAQYYHDNYGVRIARDRVIITNGSSGAFVLAFLALFDANSRVALPQPGYPCYRHILTALGCTPTMLETGPETRWMPNRDQLLASHSSAPLNGLLVASPANPTGTMLSPDRLRDLAETCEHQGIWFISDEIYHGLTYEGVAQTAIKYSDQAIVINSFSKYFSMTGWRVGWMIVPDQLVRPIERLQQNLFISANAASQVAALAAFDAREELEANRAIYAANRAILLKALATTAVADIAPADGAFYIYANVAPLTDDAYAFCRQMLEEIGVAATPGSDFDEARGHHYMRFSYAGSTSAIEEAARRLTAWRGMQKPSAPNI